MKKQGWALTLFTCILYSGISFSIINGSLVDENQFSNVVTVKLKTGQCSGVAVGPYVVLVPEYCADENTPTNSSVIAGGVTHSVDTIVVDKKTTRREKLAVLITTDPMKTNFSEIGSQLKVGDSLDIFGFGAIAKNGKTDWKLSKGTTTVSEVQRLSFVTEKGAAANSGDSGGPAFNGQKLVGIINLGNLDDKTYMLRLDNKPMQNFLKQVAIDEDVEIYGITNY